MSYPVRVFTIGTVFMKSLIKLATFAALFAGGAQAATVTPTSYDMRNGQTGSFTYFDSSYSGTGSTTSSGSTLTGGLGELTDGYIETRNWNHPDVEPPTGDGPYVGWNTFTPTIVFNFASVIDFAKVTFYFDSSGQGGVAAPSRVVINGENQNVPAPAGTSPFAFEFDMTGQAATDTISATIFDGLGSWVFLSEVTFESEMAPAVPLPAGALLMLSGLAGFGLMRRKL